MSNGLKSTEFWLTLAAMAIGLVLVLQNKIDGTWYFGFVVGGSGAYSIGRGLAKTEPVSENVK